MRWRGCAPLCNAAVWLSCLLTHDCMLCCKQMKQQELARGETAAVMELCDISALQILARRLAPDVAAAEADTWRVDSSSTAAATPGQASASAAPGPAAKGGVSKGAPFPEQWVPPPPPLLPPQPPAPLLQDLNPVRVLVRTQCHPLALTRRPAACL
jgi:hypothetical protein